MDFDGTEMFANQPTKNVEISAFRGAVDGMHDLILLAGDREGCTQIDVTRSIQRHGFFQITDKKCLLEGAAQRVATAANLHLSLTLEIVRGRDHFGRPIGGTVAADAHTTVAAVTGTAKNGEFSSATKADGRLIEGHHLGWCVGNGGFTCFPLGLEREGFQILVGRRRILGYTPLVGIDGRNPQVSSSIVVNGRREKNARADFLAQTTCNVVGNGLVNLIAKKLLHDPTLLSRLLHNLRVCSRVTAK